MGGGDTCNIHQVCTVSPLIHTHIHTYTQTYTYTDIHTYTYTQTYIQTVIYKTYIGDCIAFTYLAEEIGIFKRV